MSFDGRGPQQKQGKPVLDAGYLDAVRAMPCRACGRHAPSEPHHCRDLPDFIERKLYNTLPGAAMTSSDIDAIPLCSADHWLFHNRRSEFHRLYGKDYYMIEPTRRASGLIALKGE